MCLGFWVGCLLALPASLSAQVVRQYPALQLARYSSAQGVATYEYQVAGYSRQGELLSDVYLDVTMPRLPRAPTASALSGTLLFDAIQERYRDAAMPYSHPDLQIGTPENWSAAIYLQGMLSWGASRIEGGWNYGVARGKRQQGFVLKSRALPALRRYRVEPERPLSGFGAAEVPVDSTLVIMEGWILAPGWEPALVTGLYLRLQAKNACDAIMLDRCGEYLRFADQVIAAERAREDGAYRVALARFQRQLSEDRVSHRNARFVLSQALATLQTRPPSRRPQPRT